MLTSCLPCEKSVSGTCAERLKSTTERRFLCLELLKEFLPLVLGCEVWRLESSTSLDSSGLMVLVVSGVVVGESGASLIIYFMKILFTSSHGLDCDTVDTLTFFEQINYENDEQFVHVGSYM